jgi:hypothetical protein
MAILLAYNGFFDGDDLIPSAMVIRTDERHRSLSNRQSLAVSRKKIIMNLSEALREVSPSD